VINNNNINSKDYSELKDVMRPSHSDYPANVKYKGFNDYRGGGHFSGRLTAPIVVAGAISKQILNQLSISFSSIIDVDYQRLEAVNQAGDSIGGQVKTIISGVKVGVGEPMFDSVESRLSSGLFSIPGVKAVSFGLGEEFKNKLGSEVVDELMIIEGKVETITNNNGGINGGITNGMDIIVNTTFKPSASIKKELKTIDINKMEETTLNIVGRHDSFYVDRAIVVVEAISAFTILDLIIESEGKSWIN
jgi:chorismate synthase